jgi:hypothetical protein
MYSFGYIAELEAGVLEWRVRRDICLGLGFGARRRFGMRVRFAGARRLLRVAPALHKYMRIYLYIAPRTEVLKQAVIQSQRASSGCPAVLGRGSLP